MFLSHFSCVRFRWVRKTSQGNYEFFSRRRISSQYRSNLCRTSLGIPFYFSQILSLVPHLFAREVTNNLHDSQFLMTNVYSESILTRGNRILDDCQFRIYFTNYFLYPYHFTCWYLSSYKMIFQNRIYVSISSAKILLNVFKRKTCANIFNQISGFCHRIRFS